MEGDNEDEEVEEIACDEDRNQEGQVSDELEKDHAHNSFGHSAASSLVVSNILLLNLVIVKFPVFETVREYVGHHQML